MKLNENIKLYREKVKMTKSELARLINVSPSYITKLENGNKTNPSLEIQIKIATVLGCSLYDLTGESIPEGINNLKDIPRRLSEEERQAKIKELEKRNNEEFEIKFNSLEKALSKIDIESAKKLSEEKSKEIRSRYAESENFCLYDIDNMLYQTILEILANAIESTTLGYDLSDFSVDELDEIGSFVFNAYKLKINEILERHKK